MNQNTAWGLVLGGVAAFLVGFGTELTTAHSWTEIATPAFVGKALIQVGGVGTAIFGAIRVRQ